MKHSNAFILLLLGVTLSRAQVAPPSLQTVPNYREWGWTSIVMRNDFITVATVPAIGGRIMQYDLGSLPSVFVNAD